MNELWIKFKQEVIELGISIIEILSPIVFITIVAVALYLFGFFIQKLI